MTDLIAGFSASSSYSALSQKTAYVSPYSGVSRSSSSVVAQETSFSFDAFIAEQSSSPAVSLPFAEGEKHPDTMMAMLAEKLEGFLEPFGDKGEKLAKIITKALESLADLVADTSVDAAELSIDINFSRIEESFHSGRGGRSAVFSGFALEVSVATKTVDYDPARATVINMEGSKVELSSSQLIEGHKRGVFRKESRGLQDFPGYDPKLAEQTEKIIEFLKEVQKNIAAFSKEENRDFRHQLRHALKDFSRYDMRS